MLIPTRESFEKVFRIYKNQCSFGHCNRIIIDSDNHVNGNILFAESNKKENPRFNPDLSNREMIEPTNLIMFCDIHCWEVEKDPERFPGKGLKTKLKNDFANLPDGNFELTDEMYDKFLYHFMVYHDPGRFSHIRTYLPLFDKAGEGSTIFDIISCDSNYIKPTRNLVGGKFEIIDSKRKIEESDIVIFYPMDQDFSKGIPAKVEFKSTMRVEGEVPDIPKGKYLISLRSSNGKISKLGKDLEFVIL